VDDACRRGESALYFAFEESSAQIVRNLRSIGLDLEPWLRKGLLRVQAARTTTSGLEGHLNSMHRLIEETKPRVIVVDPISNLISVGTSIEVKAMLARLIDFMKVKRMTALFTSLTIDDARPEGSDLGISSFMDTWLVLRNFELNGERNRMLTVLKSRGMSHSNQLREFVLTRRGLSLVEAVRDTRRRTAHDDSYSPPAATTIPRKRARSR
jgi:circadian clock protein KaiC